MNLSIESIQYACLHRRAIFLSAAQDATESQMIVSELRNYAVSSDDESTIKMLYITPEKFSKSAVMRNLLVQLANRGLISRFVIDEAHCLSQVSCCIVAWSVGLMIGLIDC